MISRKIVVLSQVYGRVILLSKDKLWLVRTRYDFRLPSRAFSIQSCRSRYAPIPLSTLIL